jgi:HEAT repeat protein
MGRIVLGVGLSLVLLAGCSKDPSTPEYWDGRIADAKSKKDRKKAVEDLRASKHMGPAMVPMLVKRLEAEKSADVRAAMVRVLGETKDPSVIDPLIGAMDLAASDSDGRGLNKEVAIALEHFNDPKAIAGLLKLLKVKGDNYTVVAVIEALGTLKAKEAVGPLSELASDDAVETFLTKKAIIALGDIGDPAAVPVLVKAMFKERKGVSFYMESSFALYQFGQPAADALWPIVERKDAELFAWAEKYNVKEVALLAKAAQVEGDLHDMRAEKALVGFLNFKSDFDDIKLIMRMRAADALARMRSKEAAKVISTMLLEDEANARREYVWALARIGSKDPLPKLIESAGKGSWDARDESIRGVAMLGDDPAAFDKFAAAEEKLFTAECKEDEEYKDCKDVAAGVKKHVEKINDYKLRATAAAECKGDAACWAKKLDDANEGVRERAAYEVGRSGKAELIGELMKRLTDKNLDTRLAIIQGADWLIHDSKDAMTAAQQSLPALEKQLADEKGKTEFVKVNEDLRRLHVKVKRG